MENHGKIMAIAEQPHDNQLNANHLSPPPHRLTQSRYSSATSTAYPPTAASEATSSTPTEYAEQLMPQSEEPPKPTSCSDRQANLRFKLLPDGRIRAYNAATSTSISEHQYFPTSAVAPTLTRACGVHINIIMDNLPRILRMQRTEEEKKRRSIEGDIGAKFSESKQYEPRPDQISDSLTSVQKDNLLIEPSNDDNGCARTIKAQYQQTSAANLLRQDGFGATGVIEGEPIRIRQANEQGYIECPPGGVFDASYPNSPNRRGRVQDGGEVTPTICSAKQGICLYEGLETPSIVSHPLSHAHENPRPNAFNSPALRATDYKCPPCAILNEPQPQSDRLIQVGNIVPDHPKFKNRIQGRVYAPEGLSPTINTHTGGGLEPKIISYSRDHKGKVISHHTKDVANTITCCSGSGGTTDQYTLQPHPTMQQQNQQPQPQTYRIRKLTPRECFRLMDVDDDRIDLIQASGISKSQQYKLAGNSIVVSCLYHIFHKMFIDTAVEEPLQLSLF